MSLTANGEQDLWESISTDINAIMKGSLGVQWEKARLNYSKMLTMLYV